MQSLSDRYVASHGNSHETFADLVFCALVVMVLFVMALAIEVSQRIRADLAEVPIVEEATDIVSMTPTELQDLTDRLKQQESQLRELQEQLKQQGFEVASKLAALNGEQRFTGAREPAGLSLCYDYSNGLYHFVPTKEIEHADTAQSGESVLEFRTRKLRELVDLALKLRKQRGYTEAEMMQIYTSFSKYQEVVPTGSSYTIEEQQIGIAYHPILCAFVAGDDELSDTKNLLIELAINKIYSLDVNDGDEMYPQCRIKVNATKKIATINRVNLEPRDLRELLLSLSGRGALLDFEGYSGRAPEWLQQQVLIPTGYTGKTPRLP